MSKQESLRFMKEKKMNHLKLKKLVLIFVMTMLVLVGCNKEEGAANDESNGITVITTFYPVFEFTSQVVGENGTVSSLLSAGQDSHSYEPTPKDLAAIAEADVFIYSSEYMETWVPDVLSTLEDSDVLVIEAAEDIPFYENVEEAHDHEHEEEHEHNHAVDPHVWLDPVFAQEMVSKIATELSSLDNKNAGSYEINANEYKQKLQQLNDDYETAFSSAEHRIFVVQHAAFGYLARRYQLEELAVSSLTSGQEVSPSKMAEIGTFIKENEVKAIYYQDSANSKIAETLASETDVDLEVLSALEGITESDQEQGIDYLYVMKENLEALKKTIR